MFFASLKSRMHFDSENRIKVGRSECTNAHFDCSTCTVKVLTSDKSLGEEHDAWDKTQA